MILINLASHLMATYLCILVYGYMPWHKLELILTYSTGVYHSASSWPPWHTLQVHAVAWYNALVSTVMCRGISRRLSWRPYSTRQFLSWITLLLITRKVHLTCSWKCISINASHHDMSIDLLNIYINVYAYKYITLSSCNAVTHTYFSSKLMSTHLVIVFI